MNRSQPKMWSALGILAALFAVAMLTTACSDSDTAPVVGGGAGGTNAVTLRGAAQ